MLLRTEDLPETNCRAYAAIDSIASATSALEAAQRSTQVVSLTFLYKIYPRLADYR